MSGTRKLEKFELNDPPTRPSGTQRLEKFATPAAAKPITTPVAQPSPAVLAAARPSVIPGERVTAPPPAPDSEPLPPSRGARAADREPDVERLRTRLARKFTTLADEVTEAFVDFRIGAGAWTVELTAPEGMSTSGGKHALQNIRLRPKRQGHAVLVGGIVNPVAKTAELRDYEYMDTVYRGRFGLALEINPGEWEQFLRKAEVVLRHESITTSRVAAPRDLLIAAGRESAGARKRTLAAVALGLVVFLAAIVSWRVFLALWP